MHTNCVETIIIRKENIVIIYQLQYRAITYDNDYGQYFTLKLDFNSIQDAVYFIINFPIEVKKKGWVTEEDGWLNNSISFSSLNPFDETDYKTLPEILRRDEFQFYSSGWFWLDNYQLVKITHIEERL